MSDERVASRSWADGPEPAVSVVIPTHERAGYLGDLVRALEAQTLDASRFEVIVSDDASTDETWDVLAREADRTPLRLVAIRAEANAGPAQARNRAVATARAPVVAFTDDDCLPTPSWLEALLAGIGDVDAVQGRTVPVPDELGASGPWARTVWITEKTVLFETCNIAWRRAAFDRLGGFEAGRPDSPRGTRQHFGEDAELGWRLLGSGGTVAFAPDAVVHHRVHGGSYASWLAERRRLRLFPELVRRAPGLRRALTLGVFLSRDTAAFDLAFAALIAAAVVWSPWPLLAALPWLALRWRQAADRPGRLRPIRVAQLAVGDVLGLAALITGSFRARRPVL